MSERRFPWRALLFVSMAVNLLVIGAVIGALASGVSLQRDDPEAQVARMPAPRAFLEALPAEARVKIRAELVDSWTETRAARLEARRARRDAFAAAGTEPFDAPSVKAAFARMRAADQAAIGVFHDNMIDAFAQLTPQERSAALIALRNAAPPSRHGEIDQTEAAPTLAPAGREHLQEMQNLTPEERRERLRERIRERRQQQSAPAQ